MNFDQEVRKSKQKVAAGNCTSLQEGSKPKLDKELKVEKKIGLDGMKTAEKRDLQNHGTRKKKLALLKKNC